MGRSVCPGRSPSRVRRDDDEVGDAKPFIGHSEDLPFAASRDHEPFVLKLFEGTFPLRFGPRVATSTRLLPSVVLIDVPVLWVLDRMMVAFGSAAAALSN